jgi:thioredoxin 1
MNMKNLAIVGAVVVAAAAILSLKQERKALPSGAAVQAGGEAAQSRPLPRLVDLGAGKCIPCKAMKPILEDLRANYAGVFKTEFIDVWENEGAKAQYKVNLIPTQIFFGADGKELFRHEGFFSKEDILAKWRELGVAPSENNAQRSTSNAQR